MKYLKLLFIIWVFSGSLYAQSAELQHDAFLTTGTAKPAGDQCFELTPNQLWQGGTIWYKEPITLDDPFEMELDLKFGCADAEGADGMVFIFHPKLKNGFQGEGIGFGGLRPALGIEMDTYHNPHLGDPHYDHLALMKNGLMHHDRGISKPVSLLPNERNIEDCKAHRVKITWKPETKKLQVFIDGNRRLNTEYDIIGKIFKGNPEVFWGISSATGGESNQHMACLEKLDISTISLFDTPTKTHISTGKEYTLKDHNFLPGKSTLPPGASKELDRLIRLLKEKPDYNISINGHTDDIGSSSSNQAISQKRADAVANYLIQNGISKDRIISNGHGEKSPKFKNNSDQNRKANRRVDILLYNPRA